MTPSIDTDARPDAASAEESRADGLGNFGLVHLVACLGVGGAVALAVNLIEWLR